MSEVKVNKISPRSGTAITLGDSGDTFTIPSGATLAIAGSVTGFTSAGIDDNATSVAITINSSEQVWIGTTSPASLLDVQGTGVVAAFKSTNNNTVLRVKGSNATNGGGLGSTSSGDLVFLENLSEGMRLTSTGLGIGDTSPSAKLDVRSQINVTNSNGNSLQAVTGTRWGYSSSYKVVALGGVNTGTSNTTAIGYDPSGNPGASFTGTGSELLFRNGVEFTTPNSADDGFHHDLIVLKDGNVGMGTSSPETTLHVFSASSGASAHSNADDLFIENSSACGITIGSGATSVGTINFADSSAQYDGFIEYNHSNRSMRFATAVSSSGEAMRIDSSGNVGIGTSSPSEKLEVSDGKLLIKTTSGAAFLEIVSPGGTADSVINFGDSADNNVGVIAYEHDNNAMKFNVNASTAMRINSSGNVGIGETAPLGKLHIKTGDSGSSAAHTIADELCDATICQ